MKKYYQMRAYFDTEKGKYSLLVQPLDVKYKTKKECKKATEELLLNNNSYKEYKNAYKICMIETTEKIIETYEK